MPNRRRNVSKRRVNRNRSSNRNKRVRRVRQSSAQVLPVHRRLAVFPATTKSSWLQKLSWFGSVALKLAKLVVGVSDDLHANTILTGSGSVMLLGPGDFASHSPMAIPVTTSDHGKEVQNLKTFPFERHALRKITVRVVPSVDAGSRGGMYAVLMIPVDSVDATEMLDMSKVSKQTAELVIDKYPSTYDDIIKNPRAKMSAVTSSTTISVICRERAHNIRTIWDVSRGYTNAYPTHALCIAFSDLAAAVENQASEYDPAHALFEVHLTGSLVFNDPSDLVVEHASGNEMKSCATPQILSTNSANQNVTFFGRTFSTPVADRIDLRTLPRIVSNQILRHYGRDDLAAKLDMETEFDMISVSEAGA